MGGNIHYGHVVENGVVRYLGPTSIQKADPSSAGCLRKWFFRYVMQWKEEEKDWLTLGKQCHAEIEQYQLTGVNNLGPIASATRRFQPRVGGGHLIEHPIGGPQDLSGVKLRAAGIPIIGYCDIITDDPAIDSECEPCNDPPGTIEILDWKFGAAKIDAKLPIVCYAKTPQQLTTDVQMIGEAAWINRVTDRDAPTRLSHVYTNTKGRPKSSKATVLVTREHVEQRWTNVEAIVRTIIDAAKEFNPDNVTPNTNACEAFGGCAYREKCSAYSAVGLDTFFGTTATASLLETVNQEIKIMGLADSLNIPGLMPTAPAAPAQTNVPMFNTPAGVGVNIGGHDIAAQMAMMGQQQPAPQMQAPPPWPQGFPEAVKEIDDKGYGFPALTGNAAVAYATMKRMMGDGAYATTNGPFAGSGDLGRAGQPVGEASQLIAIAAELRGLPPKPTTAPQQQAATQPFTGALPPNAPASNPALAADPVPGFSMPANMATTPGVQVPGLVGSVPPNVAAPIMAASAPQQQTLPPAAEDPKKRGGRRKKADGATGAQTTASSDDPLWLFVTCRPDIEHTDLQDHIDTWSIGIAKHFKCDYDDVRLADKNSQLGFGGWKGAIAGVARKAAETLTPGAYYVDVSRSDINAAALEGLSSARRPDGTKVFEMIVIGGAQ